MIDMPVTVEFRTRAGVRRKRFSNAEVFSKQVDAFSVAIQKGSEFLASGEDGLQNQRILDAFLLSAGSGEEVAIAETQLTSQLV